MGALTRGQRTAGGGGVFDASDNLESTEASLALTEFFKSLEKEDSVMSLDEFEAQTGLELRLRSTGQMKSDVNLPDITSFMNRMLSMKIESQNKVFDQFDRMMKTITEARRISGELDQGVETIKGSNIRKTRDEVVYTHDSGAKTRYVQLTMEVPIPSRDFASRIAQERYKDFVGYFKRKSDGKVFFVNESFAKTTKSGQVVDMIRLFPPYGEDMREEAYKLNQGTLEQITRGEAESLWDEQFAGRPRTKSQKVDMITGAVLPVWDRLPQLQPKLQRALTADGDMVLGVVLPPSKVNETLGKLGAEKNKVDTADTVKMLRTGKGDVQLVNGWKIQRARVQNEWRLEIIGPNPVNELVFQRQGVITERIGFKARYFIPFGENTQAVFDAVTRGNPVQKVNAYDSVNADDASDDETQDEPSELRQAANEAQAAVDAQKAENAKTSEELLKQLRGLPAGAIAPATPELAALVAKRMFGAMKLQVKKFDLFIADLRVELDEANVRSMKDLLIFTWNSIRKEDKSLFEATEENFESGLSSVTNAVVQQAIEAAKAETNADPESVPDGSGKLYSTQNAFSAAARTELDMPERPPVPRQGREESIDAAKTYGETKTGSKFIDDLIAELVYRPRAVTPWENDLLNFRHVELDTEFEASLRSKIAAANSGDDVQASLADQKSRDLKQQLQTLIESVLEPIGTAAGRALQARKAVIDRSYTVVRLALEFEAAHGKAPEGKDLEAITKQVDDLNAKIAELEKMLAEADAKNNDLQEKLKEAHDSLVNKPTAPKETKKPPVEKEANPRAKAAREKIDNAYKRLKSMLQDGTAFSVGGALGESGAVFIDLATGYSELGVITLKEFLSRVGKRMGPAAKALTPQLTAAWRQVRGSADQADISSVTDKIDPMDPDTIGRAARNLHAFVIERDALDASPEGREAAVAAVHSILVDFVPGLTIDDTARAMSGIGIYSELSDNEIEVIRRDQKAQLLLLEQIGDWKKGTPPPATGQERPPVSDEQRALRKMVNDAKKASGISTTTEGQLRSALDAAKRMATNRIADLTKAIETGTRISKNQKLLQPDAELTALQESRDSLQKLYDETFGKPELTDEQRLNMAEKALDRAISDLEADLKVGKLYPDAPKPPVTSPAIWSKTLILDAMKANRDEMRLQSGQAQARSDAAFERHLLERDAELARRLAEGDFSKKPKKPERVLTPDMLKLMLSIAQDKQSIEKLRKKWEFSQRHIIVRAFMKGPVAGAHMIRKALTTLDQSLIGRQGWLLGITHPLIYAKSARKAFASNPLKAMSLFPTEQDLFDTQAALDADTRWVQLEKIAKLAVTDVHGGLNREEGNLHVPEWFDKLPGIGASERAGSAFINTQRRLVFRQLATQLATQLDGTQRSLSNAELRVIGNLVNISSGRGSLGKWANSLEALTLVFFSPRWWASRLAFWTLQPLWHDARWVGGEGASKEVRMMAAKEWTKQAAAQVAIMGIAVAALTAAFGDPGDDEEWDWYGDPRSPNFGRIRIGNSLIDMTAGLGQHLSLYSRLFSGTQVDRWETKDTQKLSLFGRHLRGKLAPIPSTFVDYLAGESMNRDKFNSMEWWFGKAAPLALQDAYKTIQEEGFPAGPLLATWMVLGGGVQMYEGRTEARADVANELRSLKKQGKTEKAQELLNKHLENAASEEAKEAIRTAEPEEQSSLQKVIDGTESPELTAAIEKEKFDIILKASQRISTDQIRRSNDEKLAFSGSDDKGRTTARSLVQVMVPTVEEAIRLYDAAYKAQNKTLFEWKVVNGQKQRVVKTSVSAGRARIRQLYETEKGD